MLIAWSTFLPRIRSATSRPFWAERRAPRRLALVSIYFFPAGAAGAAAAGAAPAAAGAAAPGAPGGPRRSPPTASSVRLPTAEWLLKIRVSANSPSLWPTMFSVMYTGMCVLPLCTAIVKPMKSGTMVERRDQVLIGRLSFPPRAFSTLAIKWWSTNGPFLTERAMVTYPSFHSTIADDHHLRALVLARLEALALHAPRRHGWLRSGGAAFAAPVRVVDRVHRHATHGRAHTAPAD